MKSSTRNLGRLFELVSEPVHIEADVFARLDHRASSIGPCTARVVGIERASSLRRTASTIRSFLRLALRTSPERLEAACERVLFYGRDSIAIVESVLRQGLDSLPLDRRTDIDGQPLLF